MIIYMAVCQRKQSSWLGWLPKGSRSNLEGLNFLVYSLYWPLPAIGSSVLLLSLLPVSPTGSASALTAWRLGEKRRKPHWPRVYNLPSSFYVCISFNIHSTDVNSLTDSGYIHWTHLGAAHRGKRHRKKKTCPLPSRCPYSRGMVTHESLSCIIVLRRTRHHVTYNIFTYLFPLSPLTSASVLLMAVPPVPNPAMDSCWKSEE